MLNLLTIIHAASVLVAIGAGVKLLRELLLGEVSHKAFVHFLRYSLLSDFLGLLFPFDGHLLSIRPLSMISVYVMAMVVLSWKYFHDRRLRRAIFAFNLAILFGLNVQIVLYHFLKYISLLAGLSPLESHATIFLIESIMTLAYSVLALVAVARFRVKNA